MAKPPVAIPIPKGTRSEACRSAKCGARVYWAPHPSTGKPHIVSVNPTLLAGAKEPTPYEDGLGVSHWADCKDPINFRAPRAK